MKIRIDREQLADKLKKAIKFIPSKSLVPSQEDFKFSVRSNMMEITAADSQSQIKIYCPVKADKDGDFCIEAKLFLKTINLFRENEVLITKKSDTVIELKNGKSKCKITMGTMPENFPVMAYPDVKHEISISQYNIKQGLKFCEKFIDDERSSRVGAMGINIHEIDKRIVFTGLDSYMLCRVNVSPLAIGSWGDNIVLPQETATKLNSLLGDKGELTLCHNGDKVVFFASDEIEKFEIVSTLVNTKYPNSESLFSKKKEDFIIINTLEFKDAFMRLRLYSSNLDSRRTVMMRTNPDNVNELILSSQDVLKPKEGEEIITINNVCVKHITKKFNSEGMLKILVNIDSNEIMFFFVDNDNIGCFIEPVVASTEEKNFNFLISSCS